MTAERRTFSRAVAQVGEVGKGLKFGAKGLAKGVRRPRFVVGHTNAGS